MRIKIVLGSKQLAGMLVLVFILMPAILLGDGATFSLHSTAKPLHNESIKLVSEILKLKSVTDEKIESKCWYILENLSDSVQSLEIGFYVSDTMESRPQPSDISIEVNGNPVEKKIIIVDYDRVEFGKAEFALWNMLFQPHEKKMVYVEQEFTWDYEDTDVTILSLLSSDRFIYYLYLASYWAGVPDKIEVFFDFDTTYSISDSTFTKSIRLVLHPENYEWVNDHTVCWKFENTDSIDDIKVDIKRYRRDISKEAFLDKLHWDRGKKLSWSYEANKRLYTKNDMKRWRKYEEEIDILKKIPNRYEAYKILLELYPAYLRNFIYAVHGYPFKTELWRSLFEKSRWYHPRDDFSESDFNGFEKRNIQFILEYEKKIKEYLKKHEKEEATDQTKAGRQLLSSVVAQAPDTLWTRIHRGEGSRGGRSIRLTNDEKYIITGYIDYKPCLVKMDEEGNVLWTRTYCGEEEFPRIIGYSVEQTLDNGYIVLASYRQDWNPPEYYGKADIYLIKADEKGNLLWMKTYGGKNDDFGYSLKQTLDGGYIIAGKTNSFGAGSSDIYLIKADSKGDTLWTKTYGDLSTDGAESIIVTSDGNYVVTGYISYRTGVERYVYLIKIDRDGNLLWSKTYGGSRWDEGHSVQQTADGGFIIVGKTNSFGSFTPTYSNVYLIKTDANGDTLWTKNFGEIYDDGGRYVQQTSDSGYVIVGNFASDICIIKVDKNGDLLWTETYNGGEYSGDRGYSVQQREDGSYIVLGSARTPSKGDGIYLIKLKTEE